MEIFKSGSIDFIKLSIEFWLTIGSAEYEILEEVRQLDNWIVSLMIRLRSMRRTSCLSHKTSTARTTLLVRFMLFEWKRWLSIDKQLD